MSLGMWGVMWSEYTPDGSGSFIGEVGVGGAMDLS